MHSKNASSHMATMHPMWKRENIPCRTRGFLNNENYCTSLYKMSQIPASSLLTTSFRGNFNRKLAVDQTRNPEAPDELVAIHPRHALPIKSNHLPQVSSKASNAARRRPEQPLEPSTP